MDPNGANAEQIEYWNQQAGPTWVEENARLDAMLEPLGRAALEKAAIAPGQRVLDVGCGAGQTTLEIAARVGAEGSALGVDISAPLLALARERAQARGLAQVSFEQADAQVEPLHDFDVVFSRYGVMFFADPVEAFANLRRALAPGGRMTFVCWRAVTENPWIRDPMLALAQHLELPAPKPGAPGPFSLADPERLRKVLERARFTDVVLDPLDMSLQLGGGTSLDDALAFVTRVGPTASLLREHPEVLPAATESLRAALEPHLGPEGVRMPSASWIVSARA